MNFDKKQPCNNCPYRTDAPLKLWDIEEFKDLIENDNSQFGTPYGCHKNDGQICVGFLLDQRERNYPSIALRIDMLNHNVSREYLDTISSPAPLYDSIEEMCYANYPLM